MRVHQELHCLYETSFSIHRNYISNSATRKLPFCTEEFMCTKLFNKNTSFIFLNHLGHMSARPPLQVYYCKCVPFCLLLIMNFSLFVRESNCMASEYFKCNTQAVLTTCMIHLWAFHIHYIFLLTLELSTQLSYQLKVQDKS